MKTTPDAAKPELPSLTPSADTASRLVEGLLSMFDGSDDDSEDEEEFYDGYGEYNDEDFADEYCDE
jgi:hypothetical protein